MIRTNFKKTALIKKLVGEFDHDFLLKRKITIVKLFLMRLKLRKRFRLKDEKLRFLYNNVYRKNAFWIHRYCHLQRWKWQYHEIQKKLFIPKPFWTNFVKATSDEFYYLFKKSHIRRNFIKFVSTRFFDRPVYFRRRTKYCRYFLKRQKFRLLYGFIKIKTLRKIIQKSLKYQNALEVFFYLMESRLDILLYRLKFTTSVRSSRQLILHGKVLVNNKVVRAVGYNLKKNDILTFKPEYIYFFKRALFENISQKKVYKIRFPNFIEYSLKNLLFKFTLLNRFDVRFIIYKTKLNSFMALLNFYNKCLF